MIALEETRTRINLEHAFAEEGRFNRRVLKQELAAETMGYHELAAFSRTVMESGVRFASGHLNFLISEDDGVIPSGMAPPDFVTRMSETIDDHAAMYAGMARTARDEGFEEIAGWFETLAKARRSHVQRLWGILHEYESKTS
jgi:rubrerythrin